MYQFQSSQVNSYLQTENSPRTGQPKQSKNKRRIQKPKCLSNQKLSSMQMSSLNVDKYALLLDFIENKHEREREIRCNSDMSDVAANEYTEICLSAGMDR